MLVLQLQGKNHIL